MGGSILKRLNNKIQSIPVGAKSAVVYTASSVFTRGLAIISVPIFTRLMTTEQIGVVNIYNSWYSLISAFATLSLTSGGFAVAMKEYSDRRDEYESSILTLTSIVAIIIALAYAIAPLFWQKTLGLPNSLIVLMLIGFLFAPARDFWLSRQRYEYKYKFAGAVSIITAIVATLASIIAVVYMSNQDIEETALGRLFANYIIIYGVAATIWIYILLKGKKMYCKEYWQMSLAISIPLIGYNIAGQVLNVSDRMMIGRLVNNSAVGIYGTLYTVSSLSLLVWQAINASFVPYLFQNIEKKNHNIKKISNMLLEAYAVIAVLLTFFAPEIVKILATKEYYEAIYIMPSIAAGVFFTSYANLYSNIAVYYKKTKYVMYPAIVAAGINLVLNYIFIKLFGYMAAAYTTLFSYIVLALLQAFWSNKVCRENKNTINDIYDNKKLFILAVATTVVSLFAIPLYSNTILRYIFIIVAIAVALIIINKILKSEMIKNKKH
ncbi:polysaccharide biosynthesis protein [Dorea formicigenerans]|uniref:Polysaccharide biosynthesis protein n=1 Tax=Dorea formicigenerans TaxID=39486 RepID=A0A412MCZ2_9FIRM|nr:polysaccharide biosynthesis protein [Dorea formicigenerans]RHE26777.1 polysaccharide biosynthesis protein [Dorea formicigenerans]